MRKPVILTIALSCIFSFAVLSQDTLSGRTDSIMADTGSGQAATDTVQAGADSLQGTAEGEHEGTDNGHAEAYEDHGDGGHASGESHGEHDMAIAARLFHGLTGPGDPPVNCASCHNTRVIDTLNWSPSALDIALSTRDMDSARFASILLKPSGKRLSVAHEGIELSPDEIVMVREYVDTFAQTGLTPQKMDINRLLFFLFLLVLFVLAASDLIFFKVFKFKAIPVVVLLVSLGLGTNIVVRDAIALGRSQDYAPVQPIKFSHEIHAGENQIDCQYCHHSAETSKSAGIPAMEVCLNCHTLVRDGTRSGRFEINKIHAAIDSGMPVEWIRVHRLPDFVFFSHAQHVGVGGLECQDCHGPVEEMHTLRQHADLSMGWCLDCHRSRKVDFDENEYYQMTFEEFHKNLDQKTRDSILVEDIGGTDCMKCHY